MPWRIESAGRIAVVTMNTNPVNAQNDAFYTDLHEAFDRLETAHADSPVVLTGEGSTFSAGIDFKEVFPIFARSDPDEVTAWFARYRGTNLRLYAYPRPVIAAVNGHAIAGGLITALGCDYRICAAGDFKLGLNEVPVGISMPSVYVELIRYALGNARTALTTLFGDLYPPDEALGLGFVHELSPPDQLLDRAVRRADRIPETALDAFARSKEALLAPVLQRVEDLSETFDKETTMGTVSRRSKSANRAALSSLTARRSPSSSS